MGRKKRDLSYLKPFCYYCDKRFDNEVTLHQHQKAKHFTCIRCQKKFSTADSLKGHLTTSHREQLAKIPYANPNRESTDLKIFGMQGVPRQYIADKQLVEAAAYWKKFLAEKEQLRKKEAKRQKQLAKEEKKISNLEQNVQIMKNERDQRPRMDNQYQHYAEQKKEPIKFNLSLGSKLQNNNQKKAATGFDDDEEEY